MIKVNSCRLNNGLRLLHYQDSATRMVALNLMYNVGSKDESANCTGLAHLMEHLMFTGSKNVPNYDAALQRAGGSSNAWTTVDVTNYYDIVPANNVETAFWVESDRLLHLNIDEKSIQIQKDVVVEEFKERCLNVPYGDISHIIHNLAYEKHPYRWPVIGLTPEHIAKAPVEEIVSFYRRFYSVNNLVMCISGNISFEKAVELTQKWFGGINPTEPVKRNLPVEPIQSKSRSVSVSRNVPNPMLIRVYHMPARLSEGYEACDLISDILSNGKSARFYQNIITRSSVFSDIDASVEGTMEPGLFMIRATLAQDSDFASAEELIDAEIDKLVSEGVGDAELQKWINKFQSSYIFSNIKYTEKAIKLCEYELLGDVNTINNITERYQQITCQDIQTTAKMLFNKSNCSTVYYSNNKN